MFGSEHVLVFAGGGVRAFYGLGWATALQEGGVRFKEIVASSSGAALSLALLSGNPAEVVEDFAAAASRHRHVDLKAWWRGGPLFTFGTAYRGMIEKWLRHDAILDHPTQLAFVAWKLPHGSERRRTLEFLHLAWQLNRELADPQRRALSTHRSALRKGMAETVFTKRDMPSPQAMVDCVMASSCLPPLVHYRAGFLDGGLALPVPVHVAASRHAASSILVIGNGHGVIRQAQAAMHQLAPHDNRVRWYFPERLRVGMWSFDRPDYIRHAYSLGHRDGRALLSTAVASPI